MDDLKKKIDVLAEKIGHTPIIDMGDGVLGKVEGENLTGSVKDRTALYMIMRAFESGELIGGGTIVEATSGNVGISLAYIARELGLKAVIVMPQNASEERKKMISSYGAQLVLTASEEGMSGAVTKARKIAESGAWFANQFENTAGIDAHYFTTAPEIFEQVPSAKYIVVGVGSGGTAMGIKRYITENCIDCKVIAVEPYSSPLMSKGRAGAHKIQGIGANFIPPILDVKLFDGIMTSRDEDAINTTKQIYRQFGIECGISSGAAYNVAMRLREKTLGNIVAILPDRGDRYDKLLYE